VVAAVVVVHSQDWPVASFRPFFSFPVPQCAPGDEWQQHEDLDPHSSAVAVVVGRMSNLYHGKNKNVCLDNTPVVAVVEMDEQLNGM
jgi:hypothetical protein